MELYDVSNYLLKNLYDCNAIKKYCTLGWVESAGLLFCLFDNTKVMLEENHYSLEAGFAYVTLATRKKVDMWKKKLSETENLLQSIF